MDDNNNWNKIIYNTNGKEVEKRNNFSTLSFMYNDSPNYGKATEMVILFGGANGNKTFKDTFELKIQDDFSQFSIEPISFLNDKNITFRSHHSMSFDSRSSKM